MDLNQFDELTGMSAHRLPEGRAYYGLVNDIDMIGYRASLSDEERRWLDHEEDDDGTYDWDGSDLYPEN